MDEWVKKHQFLSQQAAVCDSLGQTLEECSLRLNDEDLYSGDGVSSESPWNMKIQKM